ncbi:MAG: hypothetical protein V2A67_04340 [Bacteroidota bacterium]
MISVEATPPLVALAGNPVRFRFRTDNLLFSEGSKARLILHFEDFLSADSGFTLQWNTQTIRFIFKDDPDDSGTQLSLPESGTSLNAWVLTVAEEIRANYLIDQDWILTTNASQIHFTAKQPGTLYSMSCTTEGFGPMPSVAAFAGTDKEYRLNYRLGLQLKLKTGDQWQTLGEDILPVDSNGEAAFNVQSLFADQVRSEFLHPELSTEIATLRANLCREYRIRYYERYEDNTASGKLFTSESYYILAGGVSPLQEAIFTRQGSSLWAKIGYNQYFLTWQPREKLVDRYQIEKLFYLVREPLTSLVLRIRIHYLDGSTSGPIAQAVVDIPAEKTVYEFSLTLNTLQLPGYDQHTIEYYEVWMENGQGDRISEKRTYRMDYGYHEFLRYFLFKNSLGGWDTLRTMGKVNSTREYSRTTGKHISQSQDTDRDHSLFQIGVLEKGTFLAQTGWVKREEVDWLRELLLSETIYQVLSDRLVPVLITEKTTHSLMDGEDLFSLEFEYTYSHEGGQYSPEVIGATFDTDFNEDFSNA